ncbi:hypothetical protein [Rhizobium redzepovicii]|uniref:hypothetical protein n=1 Tax=Rhizobium redzepovicii TaxID=2867518 RepID=UPI0028719E12|nr:hypothetical protein [Rhizobium redzepovicii]MDR9782133.1 hypothetical protein [Rhizobium redzepovicii]
MYLQRRASLHGNYASARVPEVVELRISFESNELRDCCCTFERGEETFGTHLARTLFTIIAEAESMETAADWHDFLVHDLVACTSDAFQVDVGTEYIATFVPTGKKYDVGDDGQPDWSTVMRLKLQSITRRT